MTAPELKPCPWCKQTPGEPVDATRIKGVWVITHRKCVLAPFTLERSTREEVIAAWNTRAPDPDLETHIGAVLEEAAASVPDGWTGQPHCSNMDFGPNVSSQAKSAILALNPTALTALDRAKREARVEGMRAVLKACGPWDAIAANTIRALIEAERGKPQP